MKEHSYSLYVAKASGEREPILECEKSPRKIRNVALKIKQRSGRKVVITRDNKDLPGGAHALDKELYELWLEDHQPEFSPFGRGDPRVTQLTDEDVKMLNQK